MVVVIIRIALLGGLLYCLCGFVCGLLFLRHRFPHDPASSKGSIGLKALVFPGLVLFWPYLLALKLKRGSVAPSSDESHGERQP